MKFYKCVNEVKPSYVVETEPQFSETVLYQNQGTAVENEITLSNDYHNYDIIKIVCCDTASNNTLFPSYATPGILDYLVTDSNPYVNCNMIDTNHYIVYQINSGTSLTYQSGSNVYVTQIIGLKCTNGTITEAEIFSRQRSNSWTEINTELNLFEFNMILTLTSTRAANECVINNLVFMKPIGNNTYYGSTDINNQLNIWRVMYYESSVFAGLTNHYISPCLWYYVTGLKFIPKWDYYIDNVSFDSMYNTGLLPWKDAESKNRNWEIGFKMVETGGNMGYYICPSSNPGQVPTLELTKVGGTSYALNGQGIGQSLSNKDVKIVCYHGTDEPSPHLDLFINGTKVGTFPINEGTSTQYRTTGALALGGSYIGTKIYGNVIYFGFRWLS